MLTRIGNKILEIPQQQTLKLKSISMRNYILSRIRNCFAEYWGVYIPVEETVEYDYGYDFIYNIITHNEEYSNEFINNSITDYLKYKKDSAATIETFIREILLKKGKVILSQDTIFSLHKSLLSIYNGEVVAIEGWYIDEPFLRLFIEDSLLHLVMIAKSEIFYSIDDLVSSYNNLIYNDFSDSSDNEWRIDRRQLSNKVSQLKNHPVEGIDPERDIVEIVSKGKKINYVNHRVRAYLENHSSILKKMHAGSSLVRLQKELLKSQKIVHKLLEAMVDDYKEQIEFESREERTYFERQISDLGYKIMFQLAEVNVIHLILEDILFKVRYEIILDEYVEYEEEFWSRFQKGVSYYQRKDFKKLYYLIFSFVFLYTYRIGFGEMDYRFFNLLANTNTDLRPYMDNVRKVFKGTKNRTVFSKLFEKFLLQNGYDYRNKLNLKSEWHTIKETILSHLKAPENSYEHSIIIENLKRSDRKLVKITKEILEQYDDRMTMAEKKISSLNQYQNEYHGMSLLGEPLEEDVNVNNATVIGHFINSEGKSEFGKFVKGQYSKTSWDELTHPDFAPEFRSLYNDLFNKKIYHYKIRINNTIEEYGAIYFYNLDGIEGRYKIFPNLKHLTQIDIDFESRYGRFTYKLIKGKLHLSGNSMDSYLGREVLLYNVNKDVVSDVIVIEADIFIKKELKIELAQQE